MDRRKMLTMASAAFSLPLLGRLDGHASSLAPLATGSPPAGAAPSRGSSGHLFIVGGAEDRKEDGTAVEPLRQCDNHPPYPAGRVSVCHCQLQAHRPHADSA